MLSALPAMLRLGQPPLRLRQVAKYVKDERLRQVFSFEPLLVGGNPFRITSIYLLIHWLERKWGVWFAKGGTTSIVHGLVKLLDEMGVEMHFGTPAERIETRGGRAVAVHAGRRRIAASMVVANADPTQVYGSLLAPEERNWRTRAALKTRQYSMGLFVGYFGTRKQYPELAHHTILMGPRYRGLLDDIFDRKVLAKDFSLYLHAPTRTDPSLAPAGCETFYVLSPVPNLQSGIDWDEAGPEYFERILAHLERTLLPGLRDSLATSFHLTPTYFRDTLRSTHGAGFGIEPRLTQSAYFRYHNQSPHVGGLYFVGAGTHPGAGVPGVLSTAKGAGAHHARAGRPPPPPAAPARAAAFA
jgi:phytoene desaturase